MSNRHLTGSRLLVRLLAIGVPALTLLVTATVTALRRPLWRDEVATWLFATLDPHQLLSASSHVDAVLAPYYLLAHGVHTLIPTDFALRSISILALTLTVVIISSLAMRWWGPVPAFVAGLAMALNPLVFEMAATARPYALACLFAALAAFALDRALTPGLNTWAWVGYGASVAATGLMHLLALLTVAASVALLIGARRGKIIPWLISTGSAAVVVAPLALIAGSQSTQVSWIPAPNLRSAVGSLASVIVFEADGRLTSWGALALLLVGIMICACLIMTAGLRPHQLRIVEFRRFFFGATFFLFPWAFLLVESLIATPYLRTTYLAPTVAGLALVLAAFARRTLDFMLTWSSDMVRKVPRAVATAGAVTILCIPLVIGGVTTVTALRAAWWIDDFPELAESLNTSAQVGDTIVFVQQYSETGVDAGVARATGDVGFAKSVHDKLITGTQPILDVRRVIGLDPLQTISTGDPSVEHRVRVVYTRGGFGSAETRELSTMGIKCEEPQTSASAHSFGILRYDSQVCSK